MSRSYYEDLGEPQDFDQDSEESQCFDTPPQETVGRWRRKGRRPGTGGWSSGERSGESAPKKVLIGEGRQRRVFWDGWSEDGKWCGEQGEEDHRGDHAASGKDWHTAWVDDARQDENWSWKSGPSVSTGWTSDTWRGRDENWSWKAGSEAGSSYWGEAREANFVTEEENTRDYDKAMDDRKGKVKVAGADEESGERKLFGKVLRHILRSSGRAHRRATWNGRGACSSGWEARPDSCLKNSLGQE